MKTWTSLVIALVILAGGASVASAGIIPVGQKVELGRATVTATTNGESAVVITITNKSTKPIELLSITSTSASSQMLYFDTNMCQGNQSMTYLPNIVIAGGHSQRLGYKYQGAMLSGIHQSLTIGDILVLKIKWSQANGQYQTAFVNATVVSPPKHLRFLMGSM